VFVKKQRERLFQQNTDEIRNVDQNYKELKTSHERNVQILEKHRAMEEAFNGTQTLNA